MVESASTSGRFVWLTLSLSLLLCTAAPDASAQQVKSADAPVIGVAVPLSGDYAELGQQVLEAVELAADEAGARITTVDTRGEPMGAMKAVETLAAKDDVVAIIGPLGQRESQAAAGAAQRAGVPLVTFSSAESVNRAGPWVFRARPSPGETASAFAATAYERLGVRRVGILFAENSYGREAAAAFARAFEHEGGRVTAVGSYPEDVSDYRKPLGVLVGTRIRPGPRARFGDKRADAEGYARIRTEPKIDFDALFIPDYHGRVARLLPFLPIAGMQTGEGGEGESVQLLGMPGWQGQSMQMTGAHAAGSIYPDSFAGPTEGGKAGSFARMFEERTGRQPVNLDAEAFDVAWMIAEHARDVHRKTTGASPDELSALRRAALRRAMVESAGVAGVSGQLEFRESGEPMHELELFEFDVDGEVTPWN